MGTIADSSKHSEPSEPDVTKSLPPAWLMEKLASIEHERWADWQKWMHTKGVWFQPVLDSYLAFTEAYINHLNKQIEAPYSALSESEKQSDRDQVMRYWPLIQEWVSEHNAPDQETKNNQASLPMSEALIQAEIRGAIDGINRYEDLLTNGTLGNWLEYAHQLIADLEKKRDKV